MKKDGGKPVDMVSLHTKTAIVTVFLLQKKSAQPFPLPFFLSSLHTYHRYDSTETRNAVSTSCYSKIHRRIQHLFFHTHTWST